jgi:hypothetical protein
MPKQKPLTFKSIADRYLAERVVCKLYRHNMKSLAGRATVVTADAVNDYLRKRLESVSAITAKSDRVMLLSLWRWAYETRLIDEAPRGVMRIKAKKSPTRAWTVDQVRTLLAKAAEYRGHLLRSGADIGDFLTAWTLLGYESGSRHGDIWAFRADHLDGNILRWTQSKTGDPLHKVMTPACVEACQRMLKHSPDGRIVGWACKPRQAMRWWQQLCRAAGLPGTSKWLRRSGATHIEMAMPGKASLHLGHRTASLAAQAYIDWGQIREHAPQTPVLVAN